MSRKLGTWIVAVAVLLTLLPPEVSAHSGEQIPPLPADLLFTTTNTERGDFPRNVIVRVDANTLEVTPFYVDAKANEIIPISWSPRGDFLVIYRILPGIDDAYTTFPRELCILDQMGVLQRCLDDKPPMYASRPPHMWQQYYPITWGNTGETVFLIPNS